MRETRRESRPTLAATPLGLARPASSISGSPSSSSRTVRVEHSDIASLLSTLQRLDPSGDHKYVQQLASRLMKDNASAASNGPKHLRFRLSESVESFARAIYIGQLFVGGDGEDEVPFSQTQRRPLESSPAKLQPSMDTVPAQEDLEEEVAFTQTQPRLSLQHATQAEEKRPEQEEEFVPATQHTPPLSIAFASMHLQSPSRSPEGRAKHSTAAHTPSPAAHHSASRGFVNPFATSPQLAAGLLAALETQPQPQPELSMLPHSSPSPQTLSKDFFHDQDEPSSDLKRPTSLSLRLNPTFAPAAVAATPRSILKPAGTAAAIATEFTPSLSLNFDDEAVENGPSPSQDRAAAASPLRPASADDRKHASSHSLAAASRASSKEWSLPGPAASAVVAVAAATMPRDSPASALASVDSTSQDQSVVAMIEAMLPLDFDSLRPLSELSPEQQQQASSDDDEGQGRLKEDRVQFDLSGLSQQQHIASNDDHTPALARSRQRVRSAGELQPPTIGPPGSTQLTPRGADTPSDSRRSSRRASHARTPSWARSVARSSPPQSEVQSDEEDEEEEDSQSHSTSATPPLTQLSPARAAPSLPHTQLSALRSTFIESQMEYDAMSQAVFGGQRDHEEAMRTPEDSSEQADDAKEAQHAEPYDDVPVQSNHSALYDAPSQSRTVVATPPVLAAPPPPPHAAEYDLVADAPVPDPVVSDRLSAMDGGGWRSRKAVVTRATEIDSIPAAQPAASAPAVRSKSFQKAPLASNPGVDRSDASSSAFVAAAVPLPVWKKSKAQMGGSASDSSAASSSGAAPAPVPVRRSDRRSGVAVADVAPVTALVPPSKPKRVSRAEPPPIVDPLVPASAISQPKVDPRRQASRIMPLQLTNYLRAPTSIRGGSVGSQQGAGAAPRASKAHRHSPVESIDLCSPDGSTQNSEDGGVW